MGPDIEYALTLMDAWARDPKPSGPAGGCQLAAQSIRYQQERIRWLEAACQRIVDRYLLALGQGEMANGDLVVELAGIAKRALAEAVGRA
jgi:hypothetical protein